jgi:hypothetical protein
MSRSSDSDSMADLIVVSNLNSHLICQAANLMNCIIFWPGPHSPVANMYIYSSAT